MMKSASRAWAYSGLVIKHRSGTKNYEPPKRNKIKEKSKKERVAEALRKHGLEHLIDA